MEEEDVYEAEYVDYDDDLDEDGYGDDEEDVLEYDDETYLDDDSDYGYDEGEDYEYDDGDDADFSRYAMAARRRRAIARARWLRAQRERAAARRRYLRNRRIRGQRNYYRPRPPGKATKSAVNRGFQRVGKDVQKTKAQVQKVDIENKVVSSALSKKVAKVNDRVSGSEHAIALTKVIDEVKENFPDLLENPIIKTALPLAPLLLLDPNKKGAGVEGFIKDPRAWGTILAAGAAFYKSHMDDQGEKEQSSGEPQELVVSPNTLNLSAGAEVLLNVFARDGNGRRVMGREFEYTGLNGATAVVDAQGKVTARAAGITTIIVKDKANPEITYNLMVTVT
ncbi:MAG: Ig-like domain-containing protein [Pseudomonadota bacterium]